ncbi:MAG: NAD(P)H-binding protein [Ferruginibacter sp.]
MPFLLKKIFEDHSRQENFIKQSGLHWTIVRPGSMTNAPLSGKYKYSDEFTDKSWTVKISRADVAQFMLMQLTSNEPNKVLGISY